MGIAFLADLHFGNPHSVGLTRAVDYLVRATQEGCTGFVCAGDVIDRNYVTPDNLKKCEELFSLAEATFEKNLLVPGNHDIPALTFLKDMVETAEPCVGKTIFPDGTHIYHAAVNSDPDPRRIFGTFPQREGPNVATIGVLHTSLTGEFSKSECLPGQPQELESLGYDAWILGHVHTPREIQHDPFIGWVGARRCVIFEPENRKVRELGIHNPPRT